MTEVKPATDEGMAEWGTGRQIAIYRREQDGHLHCVECDASPGHMGGHRPICGFVTWPSVKARIDADREAIAAWRVRSDIDQEEIAALRERVAELEARLAVLEPQPGDER